MDKLWAPWRMQYINEIDKSDDCIFCTKPNEDADKKNLIVCKGEFNFVILNLFPYNNGHLMVVPYRHTSNLDDLAPHEILEMFDLIKKCRSALSQKFRAEGFNIGMNLGRMAGAGIDQHLHMHIVPRWSGDVNFMPVLGATKVISQSLESAWEELKPLF